MTQPEVKHPLFIGIDVGGTNVKFGIVDDKGGIQAYGSIPTESHLGPDDAVQRLSAALFQQLQNLGAGTSDVARIGLATPGPLDLEQGILLTPGNLPEWHNFPIRQRISDAIGLPVRYANDANAAAFGEYWQGAGTAYPSMVLLTLGTGIGGGIIVGDMLLEGAHGNGGECGHILIDLQDDAPLDSLNKRGSLEAFCGSYGVVRRAQEGLRDGRHSRLSKEDSLTPLALTQAAEAGDAFALEIILETARYLALGLVNLIHTIDPGCVVLGGAMTFGGAGHPLGEAFLQKIRDELRPRLLPNLHDTLQIDFAQLGGDAGYMGAAGLARVEHHALLK